jgi:hypothetical protein
MKAMVISRFLLALMIAVPLLAEQDASQKGWDIYEQARAAAGADQPLKDYALEQVTTIERDGSVYNVASRVQSIPGEAQRLEVDTQNGVITMLVTGDSGWRGSAVGKQPLPPEAVALQKSEDARVVALLSAEADKGSVRFRQESEVDGRPTDVIELSNVGGTPLRLFIDRETRDVLKRVYVGDAPNGMMAQVEEFLSDYRVVNGYRWPHAKRVVRNGEQASKTVVKNVKLNQGLTVAQLAQ